MPDYKIGQILTVKKDFELEGIFGTKFPVKKGSKIWIGADNLAHHLDGKIQPISSESTVKGYCTEGIAERVLTQLQCKFPIDEFCDDYEISREEIIEEIQYALEDIGF